MSTDTIQELKAELDDGVKPYSMEIKPRIGDDPLLEIVFSRRGDATYTLDLWLASDVSDKSEFITAGLVNTSPVLLVEFSEDQHGAIDQERYLGCKLVYDTFEREREHGDTETVAEYYSFAPELVDDTQQTASHLTDRAHGDAEYVYAFV
jgi:hypothetical protein